jgi:hypothetical protein
MMNAPAIPVFSDVVIGGVSVGVVTTNKTISTTAIKENMRYTRRFLV